MAEPIEQFVTEAVLHALDGEGLARALRARRAAQADDSKILAAIQADEDALEQLATDHYTDGLITRAEFFAARSKLTDRIEENLRELAAISGKSILVTLHQSRETLRNAWEDGDLDKRRAILKAVVDYIEVKPVGKGAQRFDPDSIDIHRLA